MNGAPDASDRTLVALGKALSAALGMPTIHEGTPPCKRVFPLLDASNR